MILILFHCHWPNTSSQKLKETGTMNRNPDTLVKVAPKSEGFQGWQVRLHSIKYTYICIYVPINRVSIIDYCLCCLCFHPVNSLPPTLLLVNKLRTQNCSNNNKRGRKKNMHRERTKKDFTLVVDTLSSRWCLNTFKCSRFIQALGPFWLNSQLFTLVLRTAATQSRLDVDTRLTNTAGPCLMNVW